MNTKEILEAKKFATNVRIKVLETVSTVGSGHVGGSFSIADTLAVLYNQQMKYDPSNPAWEDRDYLVLSKGHCGPALYATLALKGFFPVEELLTMNQLGTRLPSHVDRLKTPGIDMTAGSLGQGVSCALGIALGLKVANRSNHVFCIVGDGEAQEGQFWESMLIAPAKKLDKLIVMVDNNRQQLDDFTDAISPLGDMHRKAEEFGWYAIDCDGHDMVSVNAAIELCKRSDKPGFINLNTVKCKGWKEKEAVNGNHGGRFATPAAVAPVLVELRNYLKELEAE